MEAFILTLVLASVECNPENADECATYLKKGEAAPYSGQLLTDDLAVSLGLKADGCDARVAIEVDFAKRAAGVDLGLERQLRKIEADAFAESRRSMEAALREALAPPPVYERPWFVATVAVVLTVGAGSLAVWGVGQLR